MSQKKHSPYAVDFFYPSSSCCAAGWAFFTVTLVDTDFLFTTAWATAVCAILFDADVVLPVAVCFGISVAGFVTFPSDARRR